MTSAFGDGFSSQEVVYAWEKGATRLWESVREDTEGNLLSSLPSASERDASYSSRRKARLTQNLSSIRRGLIRFLVLVVDCSAASMDRDFRPSRLEVSKDVLRQFIFNYFDSNPISQMSLLVTRDRLTEKITNLSANSKHHINKLLELPQAEGLASLQNIISMAIITLKHVPEYGRREVLILYSSLSSCDPSDIFSTIEEAKDRKIRVSVICLAAEVYICKRIAELTGGIFSVARDHRHLLDLVSEHITPPPEPSAASLKEGKAMPSSQQQESATEFLYVGFPRQVTDKDTCFFSFDGSSAKMSSRAFVCPRCLTRTSHLPAQCNVCSLQLNSSAHIARSFHHLFPVPFFPDAPSSITPLACFGCLLSFGKDTGVLSGSSSNMPVECPKCHQIFCADCDIFIHDTLHNCPGCEARAFEEEENNGTVSS